MKQSREMPAGRLLQATADLQSLMAEVCALREAVREAEAKQLERATLPTAHSPTTEART